MPKTIEYYLSKGFDKKSAEYFSSGRKKAVTVFPQDNFLLLIKFDNDEQRIFNVLPFLKENTVFSVLRDIDIFKRVYIDDTASISWDIDPNIDSNIHWDNKIDISSDVCYMDSVQYL